MDKEQRKKYMIQYNMIYKRFKIESSSLGDKYLWAEGRHKNSEMVIQPTQINFKGSDFDEPRYCSCFGCGKKLSIEELRFGNKCINHQQTKKQTICLNL